LLNLLDNAVKFTLPGGEVGLEVRGDAEAQVVTLTVWDTGVGIAEEDAERLFAPFTQVDGGLARQYAGTGLGLALAYRLTALHGGSIMLESAPGQGSRFTLALPWRVPDAQQSLTRVAGDLTALTDFPAAWASSFASDVPAAAVAEDVPVILLAEDDAATRKALHAALLATGYEVVVAHNGRETIQRATERLPALVLLDVQLPEMDGLEVARHLRALAGDAHLPIIALTALLTPDGHARCAEVSIDRCLRKPVSLRGLLEIIAAYV
jgi:CheY-like chemotaxis protein